MWYQRLLNNSRIKLKITGKNIERFLKMLTNNHIELLQIDYPKRNEVEVKVRNNDYEKIKSLNTSYEIEVIAIYDSLKIKHLLDINRYFLLTIIIGYLILLLLTNIIFEVQVIHSSSNIRNLIMKELENNSIKKLKWKKRYDQLQLIEKNIINKYKDKIEWLEIEEVGTKYIVRVEERKIDKKQENIQYQHIVASRNGIIKKIEATNGDIVRIINEYVHKGDILISGAIKRGEVLIKNVKASGQVYAEVWYNIKVEYPLAYREEYETGKSKTLYAIKFLNHKLSLFDFKPFIQKRIFETKIITHPMLPIAFVKERHLELDVIDETYTKEEALIKANQIAKAKLEEKLGDRGKILGQKNLNVGLEEDRIIVNIFFSVYENIGVEQPFIME